MHSEAINTAADLIDRPEIPLTPDLWRQYKAKVLDASHIKREDPKQMEGRKAQGMIGSLASSLPIEPKFNTRSVIKEKSRRQEARDVSGIAEPKFLLESK